MVKLKTSSLVLIVVFASVLLHAQDSNTLDVLLLNRSALTETRRVFQSKGPQATPMVKKLIEDAEHAMKAEPRSVTTKEQTPPSGDKHDYMSLAPYWWPDSTQPNGLPYIRRDGEVNPEYRAYGDNERSDRMREDVFALALGYTISGNEEYAKRAIEHLKIWFLDPATKMNPNLEFAQAIKGVNLGRGIGIIETYSYRELIDGLILLERSPAWSEDIDKGMREWFSKYLDWLLTSPNGKDEAGWKNNHGSAYDVQVSCIALYLGKPEIARRILSEVGLKRIAVQVEPDGSQPLELERTKSWGYANMNLDALIELATLGKRVGIDLWTFKTEDGRSIRKAVEFLLPYALGKRTWTWTQISPLHPDRMYYSLRMSADAYTEPSFRSASERVWSDGMKDYRITIFLPQ